MPDLASRVKRKLSDSGIEARESAVATVGRHTVMTLRVPASSRSQLESVAKDLGAELSVIDQQSSEMRA